MQSTLAGSGSGGSGSGSGSGSDMGEASHDAEPDDDPRSMRWTGLGGANKAIMMLVNTHSAAIKKATEGMHHICFFRCSASRMRSSWSHLPGTSDEVPLEAAESRVGHRASSQESVCKSKPAV